MTLAQLTVHPLYEMCTAQERRFLDLYTTTKGDMAEAIKQTWTNTKDVWRKSRTLQRNDTIAALLDYIDGEDIPTRDQILKTVWKAMKQARVPHEVYRGAEIISDIIGLGVQKADTEEIQKLKNALAQKIDESQSS